MHYEKGTQKQHSIIYRRFGEGCMHAGIHPDFLLMRALIILIIWCVCFIQCVSSDGARCGRQSIIPSHVRPSSSGPLHPEGCVISARSAVPTLSYFTGVTSAPRDETCELQSGIAAHIKRLSLARARASPRPRVRTLPHHQPHPPPPGHSILIAPH